MPVKALYGGYIRDSVVHTTDKGLGEVSKLLTSFEPAPPGDGPGWVVDLRIGEGPSARIVQIQLSPIVSAQAYIVSFNEPVFANLHLPDEAGARRPVEVIALFRDRIFRIDRQQLQPQPLNAAEIAEVKLRVKRAVYAEEEELNSIKSYVANVEAAREYQKSGPKRDPIPSDVRMLVWARDGGACVTCGAKEKLHYDHIIPVAKGGGSMVENIQILCETCNLKKSDKIGL